VIDPGGGQTGDPPPIDVEDIGDACAELVHPTLVLNEFMSANVRATLDLDEQSSDWLELLNQDQVPVDLTGWGLTDDPDDPLGWAFQNGEIDPGETVLVFASGKDLQGQELHTNFSLAATGDRVLLSAPDGCPVDTAELPRLYRDVSWGRSSEDPTLWGYFIAPTPGEPNTTESRPGFAQVPALSPPPGFGEDPVTVTIEASAASQIRVTLDGSVPTEVDVVYDGPFGVDGQPGLAIVRARAWEEGLWPSRTATAAYSRVPGILDDGLKVVSLVIDPFDLYDNETGIYAYGPEDYTSYYPYFGANFWEDWERDLHIQVFDTDGELVIDQDAGVKIHGGYTRAFEQKNWRVLPRSAYGPETLDHRFFPNMAQESFRVMVLEGAGDWCPTHTENSFVDQLFRDGDGVRFPQLDSQAWEPTVVYLNGEFWGLYSFREKLDEHYIAYHHGADPEDLDRIECTADGTDDWWRISQGTWDRFDELNAFVVGRDLSDPQIWAEFESMIDLENLATAILAVGYMGNGDWWSNNLKLWRERSDTGPFRHMVFDLGHGWGSYSYDHFGVSVGFSGPGLPIADALENETFRVLLANQASDYLNTVLRTDRALAVMDAMHARIEPVIPEQYALWCGESESSWYDAVGYAREFVRQRTAIYRGQIRRGLQIDGSTELTLDVEPAGSGNFRLTAVEVAPPFTGDFWVGIPVTVTALPAQGWTFEAWSDGTTDPTRTFVLDGPQGLTALFE
jgi:hypothetical protein